MRKRATRDGVVLMEPAPLPQSGFVRLRDILGPRGPIPVCRSTWWAGVRTGRFPQPVKISSRVTAWRTEDIRALVDRISDAR